MAMMDDDFVQVDADSDGEDFEDRVANAYRLHRRSGPDGKPGGPAPHASVYDDVRSTLLDDESGPASRPTSAARPISGASQRPLSASTRPLSAMSRPPSASTAPRPLSATASTLTRPLSAIDSAASIKGPSLAATTSTADLPRVKSANFYLKKAKEKEKAKERLRSANMLKRKRESQYAMLQHMAEMNDWSEELGLGTRFRVIKKGEELLCHIYENGEFHKEITHDSMMKRYRAMQKRLDNLKASKPTAKPVGEEELQQRQEAIRGALLHTMQVTNKLKEQLQMLDKRKAFTPFLIE